MDNYFTELNNIDVSDKTEKKDKLTYLSWAWAWREIKKRHPDATYTVYENSEGWNYHTDGKTCWVKTGVTVNGIEHIEFLPVMNYKSQSIDAEDVKSVDVNKAIQRSLTKAVARHGLGLYIYAGEDLPECKVEKEPETEQVDAAEVFAPKPKTKNKVKSTPSPEAPGYDPAYNQAKLSKLMEQRDLSINVVSAAILQVSGRQCKAKELTEEEFNRVVEKLEGLHGSD